MPQSRASCALTVSFLLPIGALVGLALIISGLFVWYSAREQDKQSHDASVIGMAEYLKSRSRTIARVARDYAWWDDAVRYMQMEIDLDWADRILAATYIQRSNSS